MRSGALWAFGSDLNPYPPLEGEGRLTLSQRVGAKRRPMINSAKCETGWGDLSTRGTFRNERLPPRPAAHFIRVDPPPPGEGAHQLPRRCASLNLSAQAVKASLRSWEAPWWTRQSQRRSRLTTRRWRFGLATPASSPPARQAGARSSLAESLPFSGRTHAGKLS